VAFELAAVGDLAVRRIIDGAAADLGNGGSAEGVSDLGEKLLGEDTHVVELARRYRFASRLVSTARGYSYPTAREAALKLMETHTCRPGRSPAPTCCMGRLP